MRSFDYSSQSETEKLSCLVSAIWALGTGHPQGFFTVFTQEKVAVFEKTDRTVVLLFDFVYLTTFFKFVGRVDFRFTFWTGQ